MPTYEYKCDACGYEFERFQSIMAAPIKRCPECGKAKVRRLISTGAGLIFKGSGFYITDYRDKSYADKAKAESGSGGGSGSESGGGAEKSAGGETSSQTRNESKPDAKGGAKGDAKSDAKGDAAKPATESKPAEPRPTASKSAAKPTTPKPPKKK